MLLVHIGIPKTATTALQKHLFPSVAHDNLTYAGVFQPRIKKSTYLYDQVVASVNSGLNVSNTKKMLREHVARGSHAILLSEEMFTVSGSVDWREKLKNLSRLVDGLRYRILVTVREPVQGTYSFYNELYKTLYWKGSSSLEQALYDPQFEIYQYRTLFSYLDTQFIPAAISVARFEDVISGELGDLWMFLGFCALGDQFSIRQTNVKPTVNGKILLGYLSIADLLRRVLKIREGDRVRKPVRILLSLFEYIRLRAVYAEPISSVAQKLLVEKHMDDKAYLEERFGIRY